MSSTISVLIGALFVYVLNWYQNKRNEENRIADIQQKETKRRQDSCNYALFILIQHVNTLVLGETYLAMWRVEKEKAMRWYRMKPYLNFSSQPDLHIPDLAWLLDTDGRVLLSDYAEARNAYLTVIGLYELRKQVKARADDHAEKRAEDLYNASPGKEIEESEILEGLTVRDYQELNQSADSLLEFSQEIIRQQFKILDKMHKFFKGIWPNSLFLSIGTLDEVLKTKNLEFKDNTILPIVENAPMS
ncbi:MAG: hypothetical protein P4L50_15855 [Anaerolineaceae bacterium]|nr:hypothetical protein [Anaerolineaceae bacterium]